MDSLELLAREDEFKKLNKQLEKKTESLMREIEHVMKKQDFFSEFSTNLSISPHHTPTRKHCCGTPKTTPEHNTPTKPKTPIKRNKNAMKECPKTERDSARTEGNKAENSVDIDSGICASDNTVGNDRDNTTCSSRVICNCAMYRTNRLNGDLEFLYAFVSVNVQEKVLPHSFLKERATVESVCKFLSSKIKLLQEQIEKLQSTLDKKAAQCEVHLTHQAELEGERLTLLNKTNNLRATAADTRAKYMAVQKKLDEKERLYKEQRSETDKLLSEVKRLRSKNANVEARCASQEETIETLKHQLDTTKTAEKEFRDSTRSLSASHQAAMKQLQSQVKSLVTTVERQNALIDNLKRQNALLATEGALKALEKEYCDFLTQDL